MRLTPQCIKKDMDGLISKLIEQGVCDDSNFLCDSMFWE